MNKIELLKKITASFDVDPQNGFTPLCPDELPIVGGHEIADELNKNAKFGLLRVGSKDAHPSNPIWAVTPEKPILSEIEGDHKNVDVHWNLHCQVGTFGFEYIDGLPPVSEYDFMVYKGIEVDMHPYGACYHDLANKKTTGVIEYLKANGIRNVVVGGLATDFCVANTAKQLHNAFFNVIINLASCRGISEEKMAEEIAIMKKMGIKFVNNADELKLIEGAYL